MGFESALIYHIKSAGHSPGYANPTERTTVFSSNIIPKILKFLGDVCEHSMKKHHRVVEAPSQAWEADALTTVLMPQLSDHQSICLWNILLGAEE